MIGERIAGKYIVDARVASGPGGEVWRAEDVMTGRKALLQVHPLEGLEPEVPRKLKEKAEELREIRHAALPAVLDAGEDAEAGVAWIATEDAKGDLLADRVKKGRPFPPDKALALVQQIAEALGALHHEGSVHGALSPRAILIDGDKVALLGAAAEPLVRADFAARPNELLAEAEVDASWAFFAPERAEGAEPAFQTDTYCLALLFCWLVTGKTPFKDPKAQGFERFLPKAENPRVVFPEDLKLGEGVSRALSKSLSRSPALRHLTPRDLVRALASEIRPAAPPPPPPKPKAAAPAPAAGVQEPPKSAAPAAPTPAAPTASGAPPAREAPQGPRMTPLRTKRPAEEETSVAAYGVVIVVLVFGALLGAALLERERIADWIAFAWENRGGREIRDEWSPAEHPPGRSLETIVTPKGEIRSVSFSDGGRYMAAAASDGNVQLWLTEDWVLHRVFKGHEGPVSHVRFGARASVLYTGGADGRIFKWDLSTGKGAEIVKVDAGVSAMAVTADERNLAYASDASYAIYVQDVVWGQTVRCVGHRHTVTDLAFSANGRYLASASDDGAAKYWDATGGDAQGTMGEGAPMTAVALHPTDSAMASGDQEGRLTLWNINNQKPLGRRGFFHAAVTDIVFAPDGGSLLAGGADGRIARFSYPSLELTGVYSEHRQAIQSLALASKGDVFASASADRRIKIWPFAEGVFGQQDDEPMDVSALRRGGPEPVWRGPGGAAAVRAGLRWYEVEEARALGAARDWSDAMGGGIPPHVLLDRARGIRYEAAESQRRLAKTVRRALAEQDFAAVREGGGARDLYKGLPPERLFNRFAYRSEDFFTLLEAYERSGDILVARPVTQGAGVSREPIIPEFQEKGPAALFDEGVAAIDAEKFPEARAKFEKILEIDKRPISPLRDLAAVKLGELDKIESISRAAGRIFQEAEAALARGEQAEARRLFERVVQIDYRGLTQYPKRAFAEIGKLRDLAAASAEPALAVGEELGAKEKTRITGVFILPDRAPVGTLVTFKVEYEISGLEAGRSTTADVFHSVEGGAYRKSWKDRTIVDADGAYESLRTLQLPPEAKPGEYEYVAVVDPQGVYGARATMKFTVTEKTD